MSDVQRYAVLHRFTVLSLLKSWNGCGVEMVLAADYDALKADNARLREALVKYGEHGLYCPYMEGQCDCGLLEALGALWEVAK